MFKMQAGVVSGVLAISVALANGGVRSAQAAPNLQHAITLDDLSHVRFLQYSWSFSSDVDPFTTLVPIGQTASIEMTVHAVRSAFHSNFVNDELGGMAELCLTNSGDESTQGLGVVAEVEAWEHEQTEEGKGYGRWRWASIPESIQALLVREIAPSETVCFPYEFRLANHESPYAHYRVVFRQSDSGPALDTAAIRNLESDVFRFPHEPTEVIERDATAQVGVQLNLPEGFGGFGQFSLGTLQGTGNLHATLHPKNLSRCGTVEGWSLQTFLTLPDSLATLTEELNPYINTGVCVTSY